MPLLARARSLWTTLTRKRQLEQELDDELRAAAASLAAAYARDGMPADEARDAAAREIGAAHVIRENVRESRVGAAFDAFLIDLRYASRGLRHAPGLTLVIAATLALGIGANTALFSVVHRLLLKPLPYREAGRLVFVWLDRNQVGYPRGPMSGPDLRDLRERTRSFVSVGGIWATGSITLTDSEPEQLRSAFVTTNFFDVLGARPALGRTFLPEDARDGAGQVVLLGWDLFQRRFGGNPSIVGSRIRVNHELATVIGVMPDDFRLLLPPHASVPDRLQAWTPFWPDLENGPRANHFMRVVARLKPGVTLDDARDDVATMAGTVSREIGSPRSFTVVGLQSEGVRDIRAPLLALFAGVGMLLAIACVNIASLLIARAAARAKETALRIALGASRARLLRQWLVEGLLLATIGAAAGIGVGVAGLRLLVAVAPSSLSRLEASRIDPAVLAFTLGLSCFWGVLFSLAPVAEVFKAAPTRHRGRARLIVVQIALSTVLLVSSGLLVRGFVNVMQVDAGFRAGNHLTFRIAIPGRYEGEAGFNEFADELQQRIAAVPDVRTVGAISHIPYDDLPNWALPYSLESPIKPDAPSADARAVSPGTLESLGVTLVEGRLFDRGDRNRANPVVVIDDLLARQLWPGERAVGRQFFVRIAHERVTVVGVVRHVRLRSLVEDLSPQMFVPWAVVQRNPIAFMVLTTSSNPVDVVPGIRAAIATLDPALPIYEPLLMTAYIDAARATRRFTMFLAAAFALTALTLTCVGVYGVLAYSVARRRHELGVRRALGADALRIAGAVLREGLGFAASGCAIGVAGSLVAGPLLESQLYAVDPFDPLCFGLAIALILIGSIAACAIPARRAVTISPMDALRSP